MRRILSAVALILITTSTVLAQNFIIETNKPNETDKQYKKILIAGEGNIQGRMYLENVTTEFIKALAKEKIDCHYEYLGDYRKLSTDDAFSKLDKSQYDAVIRFLPKKLDEAVYVTNRTYAYPSGIGSDRPVTNVTVNDFDLFLTEANNTIWEGRVKTSIIASKSRVYKKISDMIIEELTKNKIFPTK